MLYREAGQFKTSYAADQAIFPIVQDRVVVLILIAAAFIIPPAFAGLHPWTSRDATGVVEVPESIAVVGGGVVAGSCGVVVGADPWMAVGWDAAAVWESPAGAVSVRTSSRLPTMNAAQPPTTIRSRRRRGVVLI